MNTRLRGVAGAFVIALYWGFAGFFVGMAMEVVDPNGELVDIWPAVFAFPGFAGGLIFAGLLAIAERGRSYADISLSRGTIWGAVTALLPLTLFVATWQDVSGPNQIEALSIAISMAALTLAFPLAGALTVTLARKMAAAF